MDKTQKILQYLPVASALVVGGLTLTSLTFHQGMCNSNNVTWNFEYKLLILIFLLYNALSIFFSFFFTIHECWDWLLQNLKAIAWWHLNFWFWCSGAKCPAICVFNAMGWCGRRSYGSGKSQWKTVLFSAPLVWSSVKKRVKKKGKKKLETLSNCRFGKSVHNAWILKAWFMKFYRLMLNGEQLHVELLGLLVPRKPAQVIIRLFGIAFQKLLRDYLENCRKKFKRTSTRSRIVSSLFLLRKFKGLH